MTALMNALVALYVYSLVPEFLLRFVSWLLIHTVYRVDERGLTRTPDAKSPLRVCSTGKSTARPQSPACMS